jgi:hypothetical protein
LLSLQLSLVPQAMARAAARRFERRLGKARASNVPA